MNSDYYAYKEHPFTNQINFYFMIVICVILVVTLVKKIKLKLNIL